MSEKNKPRLYLATSEKRGIPFEKAMSERGLFALSCIATAPSSIVRYYIEHLLHISGAFYSIEHLLHISGATFQLQN